MELRPLTQIWKKESLSESFGSRWASKVKINVYYKKIKVFFLPCIHVDLLLGIPKTKNMNLSLPIIGAFKNILADNQKWLYYRYI